MNVKKLLAIAALLSLALPALPSAAATVTKTVTVKWNTQAVATLNVHTDYAATGLFGAAAGAILANLNGGAGICTATDPTNTDLTVDFGAVTPDTGTNYTDCMYKNAVNAQVVTSSTNWQLAAQVTTGSVPADTELCALPNGIASFPASAAALPVVQTARGAAPSIVSVASCPAGDVAFNATSATLANETNAFSSASPANVGHDLELVLKPLAAASGGSPTQVTVTYTLTAN
jgi:hypothetical protein